MDIVALMTVLNQIKVLHWLTTDYSVHVILNEAYETIEGLLDEYAEAAIGEGDNLPTKGFVIRVKGRVDDLRTTIRGMYETVLEIRESSGSVVRTVILDDMLKALSKANYLLRMS